MEKTAKSPAKKAYYVWADHTDRVYQEVEAESPEQAYQIAEQQPDCWQPCFEQNNNDYRLSNDVADGRTGKMFTVGEVAHCKTCGSEIVKTVNDGVFRDGECNGCEYQRYRSQPDLLRACQEVAAAVDGADLGAELWERLHYAIHNAYEHAS
jgi:hypothetical protein